MKSPMEELGWLTNKFGSFHFVVSLICPHTLGSNAALPAGLSWRSPNVLVRNSAALIFILEIAFWLKWNFLGDTNIDGNDFIPCLQASLLCH